MSSRSSPCSITSANSSPPNRVLRGVRFGHCPCCKDGRNTIRQCLPAAPAGVASVTAWSIGAVRASESASMASERTCSMNVPMVRAAITPSVSPPDA